MIQAKNLAKSGYGVYLEKIAGSITETKEKK
jgi:hypothetical protein